MEPKKEAPPEQDTPSTLPVLVIGAAAALLLPAWPYLLLAEPPRLWDLIFPALSFFAFLAALRFRPHDQTLIGVLLILVLYGPFLRFGSRFSLPALPGLVLLVVIGVVQLLRAWLNRPRPSPPPAPPKPTDAAFAADADLTNRGIVDER